MSKKKFPLPIERLKEVRRSPASISVGKYGISESLINEIKKQLKKKKIIKIKIHKSILINPDEDRQRLALEITTRTRSILQEIRGNTFIIYKE
ncbi:MAG: YhbY family RNA-binding protein [Candidatus Helarchaeales archaeon]